MGGFEPGRITTAGDRNGRPGTQLKADGRCSFGIETISLGVRIVRVEEHERLAFQFGSLTEFAGEQNGRRVLLVAPLAGAYPILLRDLLVGLLRHATVAITDWRDARYVPQSAGAFGLAENIGCVLAMMRAMGPEVHVVAVCQGTVPALAATALLSRLDEAAAPRSLTLVAGPIDPLAKPTRVVLACRSPSAEQIQRSMMRVVPNGAPGAGRWVYPATAQCATLSGYVARHWMMGEIFWKLIHDDGEDPARFPFWSLVTRFMNLPAELVLDMVRQVFINRDLCRGALMSGTDQVAPSDIRRTGLMTIEGEKDDIAGPGQTLAAHALCSGLPDRLHRHLLVPDCAHFGLFHGARFRSTVLPAMLDFIRDMSTEATPPRVLGFQGSRSGRRARAATVTPIS